MNTERTMLNFRCPNELLEAIDTVGKERYPAINKNGCDRSKTLIDIISAGIQALTDGSIVIPIQQDVRQDEVRPSIVDINALKAELQTYINQQLEATLNSKELASVGELSA